jgi:hypothetical protein
MKTRTLALPVLMLLAALSGACTTMTPLPASSQPVFLGLERIQQKREYLDRYSCGNTTPLYCSCPSTLRQATCYCGCPRY